MFSILNRNIGRVLDRQLFQSSSNNGVNSLRQYSSYSFANQQILSKLKPIYSATVIGSGVVGSIIGFGNGISIPVNDVLTGVSNTVCITIYGGCGGLLYGVFSPITIPATAGVLIKMAIDKKN